MSNGISFTGKQGDGIKGHSTKMPTGKMGGSGGIKSPVGDFPSSGKGVSMPSGKVPSSNNIQSPAFK